MFDLFSRVYVCSIRWRNLFYINLLGGDNVHTSFYIYLLAFRLEYMIFAKICVLVIVYNNPSIF